MMEMDGDLFPALPRRLLYLDYELSQVIFVFVKSIKVQN